MIMDLSNDKTLIKCPLENDGIGYKGIIIPVNEKYVQNILRDIDWEEPKTFTKEWLKKLGVTEISNGELMKKISL
jgi:hypothetical protein